MKDEHWFRRNTESLQLTGWDIYNYPRELERQKVVRSFCIVVCVNVL